jgi:gamma-glutamylcyclotransferase
MVRYFAYGSALSKRHISEWASEHGVDPRLFEGGVPAMLRGYSLVFDVESRLWGGRVANLARDEQGTVHGVLFEIPDEMEDAIARKEGVPTGLSEEIDVTVQAGGQNVTAKAFIARPEKRTTPGPASARLLEYLIEGAQERGLPPDWIAGLRKHQAPSGGVKLGMKR